MASERPKAIDFQEEIFSLEGDVLAFEDWAAGEHSLLDTLGIGNDASSAQGPTIPEGSFAATTAIDSAIVAEQYFRAQKQDNVSVETGDTSQMADGCHANLATYSFYYQTNHICTEHLKSESFSVHSVPSRFCQRCGLSHALTEFDGKRKSCRVALEKHNNRRKARIEGAGGAPKSSPAAAATAATTAADAAPLPNFAGFPGVADLSGWDPNLARELELLLSDDPIIDFPPDFLATAASGAIGTVQPVQQHVPPPTAATAMSGRVGSSEVNLDYAASSPLGAIPMLHPLQTGTIGRTIGGANGTNEQPELGFDGQPLSPTLLRLARIDPNSNDYDYQQMIAPSPFAMDLPSLENLTRQQPPPQQQHQQQQQQNQQHQQQNQQQQ